MSLQFYGFHETKRQILQYTGQPSLNLWPQTYIAGQWLCGEYPRHSSSGAIAYIESIVRKPVSLRETVSKIYREQGIVNGIYRGFGITLIREIQAYGVWF